MPPTAAGAKPRVFLVAVAAMLTIQIVSSFAIQSIPVLAPVAAPDLGVSRHDVGYFMAFVYVAAILSSSAGGLLAARYGAVRVSQASLLCSGAAITVFGLGSVWLLVPAALLLGTGMGPPTPASSQVLARVTPPRLASLTFSVKQTGVPLGNMVAGLAIPALVALGTWQGAAWVVGLCCLALAIAIEPLRPLLDVEPAARAGGGVLAAMRDLFLPVRRVWNAADLRRLALVSFVFTAMQVTFGAFLVVYLVQHIGLDLATAGLVLAIGQLTGAGARVVWGAIADSSGRPALTLACLCLGMAAGAATLAMLDTSWSMAGLAAAAILYGATAIGWGGVFFAELARRAPAGTVATITGGAQFFTFSGALVVPPLFSLLLTLFGSYALNFALLAGVSAACIALLLPLVRSERG
ncbi:MFS transporter [Vineibacter terrae]|uniref:MFS transporter n=1 Tax=Vineibacter terrae TaxID=2586908 RepID=A0A5C8PJZ4_9HYPH|nr:MFS transporter [Vineibacter terrae]TXL73580.1 MFS transporter [Vineibacter terrae]